MGKRTRSLRVPEDLDSRLVSEADRLGVPIQRLLLEGLKLRLGVKFDVSQVVDSVSPPEGIVPVTSGFVDLEPVVEARGVVSVRCVCEVPNGRVRCLNCGKVR